MGIVRRVLLAGSESAWLRERAPSLWFVRTAVARFMPGERAEDALAAAAALRERTIGAVFTQLGENVGDLAGAERAAGDYHALLPAIHARGLDSDISVKLTQLGLDVDEARCRSSLRALARRAAELGVFVWIDMEQHGYVDRTLQIHRDLLAEFRNVGVCLQAYLRRTASDLESLLPHGGGVRLVKGAYREPASVAFPSRRDVDENALRLAIRLLSPEARAAGVRAVFGTHDRRLIARIQQHARERSLPPDALEFHLLFGIRRDEQLRLTLEGHRVRVLISYGSQWFPWYMRRLAERPANLWFVVKSTLSP